jgi:hypothetical protein
VKKNVVCLAIFATPTVTSFGTPESRNSNPTGGTPIRASGRTPTLDDSQNSVGGMDKGYGAFR